MRTEWRREEETLVPIDKNLTTLFNSYVYYIYLVKIKLIWLTLSAAHASWFLHGCSSCLDWI